MKIYIACGLTQVPRTLFAEYVEFIHELAASLSIDNGGHHVKYALVDSDPKLARKPAEERARLCYLWDRKIVSESDLIIAECSFPSIGLGIEMQTAENFNIPIVICYRDFGVNHASPVAYRNPDGSQHNLQIGDGFVSLMALGIPAVFSHVRYTDRQDGITQIAAIVRTLKC